jgi:putative peptidoglycan binding protein
LTESMYFDDHGWRIATAAGNFAIDSPSKELFVHIQYKSGIGHANDQLMHIGRFSTLKDYSQEKAQGQPTPYLINRVIDETPDEPDKPSDTVSEQKQEVQEVAEQQKTDEILEVKDEPKIVIGPIESGNMILNPSSTKDAKLIQKQLAELGFYTMKVDGAFGKGSHKALKKYKQANGLGDNDTWDIQIQKALFKDSGL